MLQQHLPVLIIPAFNPDATLIKLLAEHRALNLAQECIIVNDGSHEASSALFIALEQQGYVVLHHDKNQGKGAALKTAMNYYLAHFSNHYAGVITADADGQHSIHDIVKMSRLFLDDTTQLHLGVRQISKAHIPLRSRVGNVVTKYLFNCLTKSRINDTQTGLRVIPRQLVQSLVLSSRSGYEFEFEMFFIARQLDFKIKQIPIETIYIDNNRSSHFNPLFDSLRIYYVFIRFCCVAMCSFLLDFSLFGFLYYFSNQAALSVVGARLISVPFNFFLNKNISFKYKDKLVYSALLYVLLACVIGLSSFQLMSLLHYLGFNIYLSKIMAEFLIFIANFVIQYVFIFAKRVRLVEVS